MKPRKTPSGKWMVQIYDYTDDQGKQHQKKFTHADKKELMRIVAEYQLNKDKIREGQITLDQAIDVLIELKKPKLSPATIVNYNNCKLRLSRWKHIVLQNIDDKEMQKIINELLADYSQSSVKVTISFLKTVMRNNNLYVPTKAKLPPKIKKDIYIPTTHDINILLDYFKEKDNEMYKAVLLGAVGCMRRGEIAALDASDVSGNTISINKAYVKDSDNNFILKSTKTYESTRNIEVPDFLIELLPQEGQIVNLSLDKITKRFIRAVKVHNMENFSFHKLRHYCASQQIYLQIPLIEIQKYGGWSNTRTLEDIYSHCLADKKDEISTKRNNFFAQNFA